MCITKMSIWSKLPVHHETLAAETGKRNHSTDSPEKHHSLQKKKHQNSCKNTFTQTFEGRLENDKDQTRTR